MRSNYVRFSWFAAVGAALGSFSIAGAASVPDLEQVAVFTDRHCSSCHNDVDKEGGLDLTTLTMAPGDAANFATWVKVHDRIQNG